MDGAVDNQHSATERERSTSDLVKQLSEQVSTLIRDELRLAQLEVSRKAKQAGLGAGFFGGAGVLALYGIGCLIACVIIAISAAVAAWLAALIVGGALLIVAGVAAVAGRQHLRTATPPVPTEAVASIRTDVHEIAAKARR